MNDQMLFSDMSELYARARPRYPSDVYEYLARVTPQHTRAWDCACGNGQVAVDLKKYFDRVDASDISRQQIAHALPVEGIHYSVTAGELTDFEDNAFDLICVGQALHWFDHTRFWPEVDRLLKPDGVFAAWGYIFPNMNPAIDCVLNESLYPVIAPYWSERNRLLWNHYRDVQVPYTRLPAPRFELTMNWNLDELLAYIRTWSAVTKCIEALGDAFYQITCRNIGQLWGDRTMRQKVQMDFCFVASQKTCSS